MPPPGPPGWGNEEKKYRTARGRRPYGRARGAAGYVPRSLRSACRLRSVPRFLVPRRHLARRPSSLARRWAFCCVPTQAAGPGLRVDGGAARVARPCSGLRRRFGPLCSVAVGRRGCRVRGPSGRARVGRAASRVCLPPAPLPPFRSLPLGSPPVFVSLVFFSPLLLAVPSLSGSAGGLPPSVGSCSWVLPLRVVGPSLLFRSVGPLSPPGSSVSSSGSFSSFSSSPSSSSGRPSASPSPKTRPRIAGGRSLALLGRTPTGFGMNLSPSRSLFFFDFEFWSPHLHGLAMNLASPSSAPFGVGRVHPGARIGLVCGVSGPRMHAPSGARQGARPILVAPAGAGLEVAPAASGRRSWGLSHGPGEVSAPVAHDARTAPSAPSPNGALDGEAKKVAFRTAELRAALFAPLLERSRGRSALYRGCLRRALMGAGDFRGLPVPLRS